MKIKNLNIRLASLATAGLLVPFSLCGCNNSHIEENNIEEQNVCEEITTEERKVTKEFDVGKHYMMVHIEDPTKERKQYRYIPGYKPVGISTSAYGQNFYIIVGSEMLYVNDYPVEVTATRDKDGFYQYNSFGSPIGYERKEHEKIDGKKEFFKGEHIVSVPVTKEMLENNEFEVHDGYEPIGIAKAMSGKNFSGFAGACILYTNTETVLCSLDKNNEYTLFGTIKTEEKIMEKNK